MSNQSSESGKPSISFVIPLKDEQGTIQELFDRIKAQADEVSSVWEVLFIDDGSSDGSWELIEKIASEHPANVNCFRLRRNHGKAPALALGFKEARHEIVFTLDADLQDDPTEIPRFLEKLDEGFDIVTGWKRKRHDPWHKVFPSRIFNKMLSKVNEVHLHDHNCGFKCYRREVLATLPMYGEMHRMVPSLGHIDGFKTAEIPVQHHARVYGQSKYGVKRFLRGFMDMWTVYFIRNFRERPLHLMGGSAILLVAFGVFCWTSGAILPLPDQIQSSLTAMLPVSLGGGVLLMMLGFHSELVVHKTINQDRQWPVIQKIQAVTANAPNLIHFKDALDQNESGILSSAQPKVLIIDDESMIRSILGHHLKQAGWIVLEAGNSDAGLELMDDSIDLVFLDIFMPGTDGLTALPELAQKGNKAKIVMLSSENSVQAGVQAIKGGAYDYLCKPFKPAEILSLSRKALTERRSQISEDSVRTVNG